MTDFDFCSFNIRGLHNKLSYAKDFINNMKLSFVALLETRVKEGDAASISAIVNRRFHWCFNYEHHQNGRIWVGWDPNFWTVVKLFSSAQQISFLVTKISDNSGFVLTVVYAYNEVCERRDLWKELITVNDSWVEPNSGRPWCVLGDFNSFLMSNETTGILPRNHRGNTEFRNCVSHIGVTDLSFSGEFFTWRDSSLTATLLRKLDRVLVNEHWLNHFDLSKAVFLPRGLSDHCPAAVSLGCARDRIFKPFQVFAHLLHHPDFLQVVNEAWEPSVLGDPWFVLTSKLKRVKDGMKCLNRNHGNLTSKVDNSRTALLEWQSTMSHTPTRDDLLQEFALMTHLKETLDEQEVLLKQKSRIKWLHLGDGNNRFFFNSCKSHWNSNKILSLDHNGSCLTAHRDIAREAVLYFKSLMGASRVVRPIPDDLNFPKLTASQSHLLSRDVTSEEILSTFNSLAKNKCPGPDGFTSEFFLSTWNTVGHDVTSALISFFNQLALPGIVNSAALALIPKVANASSMTQYRPISCCNVLYKAISKLITNRMKPIMPSLVSPNQAAFVHGRKLADHVLLAQTLCRDYHINRDAPRICFKLDISKAFDMLSWDFLFNLLDLLGFNSRFTGWIRKCITGSMVSVKINGALEGYFRCKSGLKQGDPLSPYLFVIAMEALTRCILLETGRGNFKFHSRAKEAEITHLIFADDVMLFSYGDTDSVSAIMRALELFSGISGLHMNPAKCLTFFGNVPNEVQDFTIAVSKFNRGVLPVMYLGLPLISGKLSTRDCQPLVSKLVGKFESWSCNFMNQAGRAQLIKSVIYGIHGHWSSYLFLPVSIIKRIQSYIARFLWKGRYSGPCFYKVNWKQCCLRKSEGGLGFKELLGWNQCAIFLQVWRIVKNQGDSLWLKWVNQYLLRRKAFWTMAIPEKCSWALRKILKARPLFLQHASYIVGRNSNFLLWHDPWVQNRPLVELLGRRVISSLESNDLARINSILHDGIWDLGPSNDLVVRHLRTICAQTPINDRDDILWDGMSYCNMKISVLWDSIRPTATKPSWFDLVWCKFSVPKFAFHMWLVVQERLLTKDRMINFRMQANNLCILCGSGDETHEHLFCHCRYTRSVLSAWPLAITSNWSDIIAGHICISTGLSRVEREMSSLFISVAFYWIWRERNSRLHAGTPLAVLSLFDGVKRDVRNRLATCDYFKQCVNQNAMLATYLY